MKKNTAILCIHYNQNSDGILDVSTFFVYGEEYCSEYLCIDKIFERFEKNEKTRIFVDDLTIFCPYLLKYALERGMKTDFKKNNNVCSCIIVDNYTFINFKSKFGCDFDYSKFNNNIRLIEYAEMRGRNANSLGADAYHEFIHTILRKKEDDAINYTIMRNDNNFPIFDYDEMLLNAKIIVYGLQFVKSGEYHQIYDYDISGSYPSNALNSHPVGLPFYFDRLENVPKSYFKIIKFTYYNCKCVADLNWLDIHAPLGTLTLTERLFAQFQRDYKCTIKIKKIEAFKTRKSMFARFITQNVIDGKQKNNDKLIAKYNKYIGNAIIGYMGRNTKSIKNSVKMTPTGLVFEDVEQPSEPMYLPAYLAILDHAKSHFIDALRPHFKSLIYANTDGFMSTDKISLSELNSQNTNSVIGNFRLQHIFDRIYISSLNGYAGITTDGELVNVISGMSTAHSLSVDEYKNRHFTYYMNTFTADGRTRRVRIEL